MSGHSSVTELASSVAQGRRFAGSALSDYWALTKPEVNFLILITTGVGFYLGCGSEARTFSFISLFNTLLGTLLVATVLTFGIVLAVIGSIYLAIAANLLASLLAILTLLTYLFVYTPLKRKTPLCVFVGAFPGAMPPLIGWAAASGRLNVHAGALYAILFLWQFPHFMAIAWMYREDYDRAGYLVLPNGKARVPFVTLETLLPLIALVAISMVQFPTRHAAIFYCAGALLSLGFLYFGFEFVLRRSRAAARRLLAASIVYLPLLFVLSATLCNRGRS